MRPRSPFHRASSKKSRVNWLRISAARAHPHGPHPRTATAQVRVEGMVRAAVPAMETLKAATTTTKMKARKRHAFRSGKILAQKAGARRAIRSTTSRAFSVGRQERENL